MHRCKDCDVQFEKTVAYFDHRRNVHPNFTCPECNQVFGMRKKFKNHLRVCLRPKGRNRKPVKKKLKMNLSNKKGSRIITAKELDTQFEIYIERKFGKSSIFPNEKMCKFCCKTFAVASEFADHIRGHYTSIALDATGVKSKFDFMKFMGLKIREIGDTKDNDTKISCNKLQKYKTPECRVVIIGERCEICRKSFKCIPDLDFHKKKYHPVKEKNRKKVMIVLKIGDEIISRIPLKKRYVRPGVKLSYQLNYESDKIQSDKMAGEIPDSSSSNSEEKDEEIKVQRLEMKSYSFDNKTYSDDLDCESVISFEKRSRGYCMQDKINQLDGNVIHCQETRGDKEISKPELETGADQAKCTFGLHKQSYQRKIETPKADSKDICTDSFCSDTRPFSNPWEYDILGDDLSWYSATKLEEKIKSQSYEENYFNELTSKEFRNWEEKSYNSDTLNDNNGKYNETNFELPCIYKYHCNSKSNLQTDFNFPSVEESYDFQIRTDEQKENNINKNNEIHVPISKYTSTIVVKKGTQSTLNYSRPFTSSSSADKSFEFSDENILGTANYQKVIIKEEIILD